MRVYHGSYTRIVEIDLSKCEPQRDFGQGFYVTKYLWQAEYWAFRKGEREHTEGVVTELEFDENIYHNKKFNVLHFEGYNDEWFDFVILNRKSRKHEHDYDIVEGPVADDKIQRRLQRFLNGEITRPQFFAELKYPKLSHQICFCTTQSLRMLQPKDYTVVRYIENVGEQIIRLLIADYGKSEREAFELFYSSNIFTEFPDDKIRFTDKSWRQIYEMLKAEKKL